MWRIAHSDRRHRLVGLIFYILLIGFLMLAFLDGAGYRHWQSSLPQADRPYELIELKKQRIKQPGTAQQDTDNDKKDKTQNDQPAVRSITGDKEPDSLASQQTQVPQPQVRARPQALSKSKTAADRSDRAKTHQPKLQGATVQTKKVGDAQNVGTDTSADPKTPVVSANGKDAKWHVQAASYTQESNAFRLKEKLAEDLTNVYIEAVEIEQQKYYRVRIGPLKNEAEAKKIRQSLKAFGIINARIDPPIGQ